MPSRVKKTLKNRLLFSNEVGFPPPQTCHSGPIHSSQALRALEVSFQIGACAARREHGRSPGTAHPGVGKAEVLFRRFPCRMGKCRVVSGSNEGWAEWKRSKKKQKHPLLVDQERCGGQFTGQTCALTKPPSRPVVFRMHETVRRTVREPFFARGPLHRLPPMLAPNKVTLRRHLKDSETSG